jgi:hypothetical protein
MVVDGTYSNCTLKKLTVRNISSFYNKFLFFVERYLVTLLISLSYCEYVPTSTFTNIPFYYLIFYTEPSKSLIFIWVKARLYGKK